MQGHILEIIVHLSLMATAFKTTKVQKCRDIKPVVISDSSIQYDPLEDPDTDDPKIIEDMVRSISQLDKKSHEQIYLVLRNSKPRKFFAANNVDTRFNIYGLDTFERRELKRTIQLCLEDMKRRKIMTEASSSHKEEIMKLDGVLQSGEIDNSFTDLNAGINPTESEKIKEMLQMNA
jgi:hypothetical protein